MKNKRNIYLGLILFSILFFVGCSITSTEQRRERLKELLKEKYGEEFEIREIYENGAIKAWCYPIKNNSLIFSVTTTLDMDRIEMDEYIQKIVASQIDLELQPIAENSLGRCFVSTNIPLGATTGFPSPDINTISLESLLDYEKNNNISNSIFINVFIERELNNDSNDEQEFQFINEMGHFFDSNGLRESALVLYFGDALYIKEAWDTIEEYGWDAVESNDKNDIYDVLNKDSRVIINYKDGKPIQKKNTEEYQIINIEEYIKIKKKDGE